jgi:hypothetical protein
MAESPPLTRDLAVRIERLIGYGPLNRFKENTDPDAPKAAQFGQTVAVKAKTGRPCNDVFCFGYEDIDRLDDILAFYAVDDLEPRFYLAPMGFRKEVAAVLTAAKFVQYDYEQAILYGLPATAPAPLPAGVTIERVITDNLEEFVRTTADGFEWPNDWRDAAMQGVRSSFTPDGYRFLARYEGQAAGVGSLGVGEDGVARLNEGAVIPKFRRKGCHLALVHHRLYAAHTLGCNFVLGAASFNSPSFQNQQRAGLRLAYIESEWRRQIA